MLIKRVDQSMIAARAGQLDQFGHRQQLGMRI
jgi:hypothetical protein